MKGTEERRLDAIVKNDELKSMLRILAGAARAAVESVPELTEDMPDDGDPDYDVLLPHAAENRSLTRCLIGISNACEVFA